MKKDPLHPRFLIPRVTEALADSPVVLIHGPRQSGKTTLARLVGDAAGYVYISFDNDVQRAAAEFDPVGFVADLPDKVILDEIQRVPGLFTSLKAAVDSRRQAGRFILTGSANVLLVPKLADSLAGRMEILRLHPLAQCELAGRDSGFLSILLGQGFKKSSIGSRQGRDLAERIAAGGFPAALARTASRRRAAWYRDYIDTLVQRDVRDLSAIRSLEALPRLLALAAGQTAHLVNVAELSGPFQLSRPTIRDYMTLLERLFLLEQLPPWHNNRLSRLIKTPKLHLCDTGLACALLGVDGPSLWGDRELYGQLLETFVYQELRRQSGWQEEPVTFYHYRDKEGLEVDVVLEFGGRQLAGVEVKASSTVGASDFRGLIRLQKSVGKRFEAGVVLYDGDAIVSFGKGLFAVPISMLWEKT
ncbi:ATP-binding protein [Desulfosudis oleivorans]|uniref:ATPase, AAA+ superfamily n=1 Tax=Desulfosudis oleivorans (strain DSM 6200 / JCM 39069 / Hxd3) TaxID=96561 RepID=A8ZYY5_DESOH|nr:ATP-binding protein [Desulfosudis oleivorans]ABW68758.1 ATPase, AAA+ superfamily [Desulfosudis oleivorans Hxd3]